ncbi:TetR/AcrR family transcriptional regulator [Aquabacter sp. CN5-332]|uniref:TetR/AcrR family transcriptional regulator n=1 Tax=Aquabacter sp. CN5-332 TaxID=3156608 RepID=UPI0032B3B9A1
MLQNHKERRPRGRPPVRSDEETLHLIVEAAAQEFQANGFAGTSVDAVARRAGVSSRTLYRLVPTKAALFSKVISEHIDQFITAIEDTGLDALALDASLERILISYGILTLGRDAILMLQLVVSERGRFPELASTFYTDAMQRTGNVLEQWLRHQQELGRITLEDPALASGMLRGMITMEPQRGVLLGQRTYPEIDEIRMRARMCARLFLDGCRTKG